MNEEWGPWIEHDGKGWPPFGFYLQAELENGTVLEGMPTRGAMHGSWRWLPGYYRCIRYRIRKPRALLDMIALVEALPAPAAPKVDA